MNSQERIHNPLNRRIFKILLLIVTSTAAFACLLYTINRQANTFTLSSGDVAPLDILAPYSLTYISQDLSEQARNDAQQRVSPVYLPSDPSIARKQIDRLRVMLNYISVVRFDAYASQTQKLADIALLKDITIDTDKTRQILALNETRWESVQREALNVLEQVMRETIRDNEVHDAQRRVPTLISFSLSTDLTDIVTNLVTPYVTANSLFSPEQTQQAREDARAAVEPISKSYVADEIIVRRGQIITPTTWEALQKFGLITPQTSVQQILAALALTLLMTAFVPLYIYRRKLSIEDNLRGLLLIAFNFILFLGTSRLVISGGTIAPYLFPLAAFGMTIAALFPMELALLFSLVLSILTAYGLTDSLNLSFYYILSSLVGILVLGKATRISHFFWAGIAMGLTGAGVIVAYRYATVTNDLFEIAMLAGASLFAGIASASLSLIFQFLYSQMLGLTTALQMLEISRPDHPLLQYILQNAPGSYQHSLQVSVLAEQAAEKIGADSLLVRVGGMYHDAGKASNPSFFIENQVGEKLNPHDDLDPVVSAQTILRHVTDGLVLARKYRLPPRIQDFIREHHGTMITRYQYTRAVQAAGNDYSRVDESLFRYTGPIPASRETALLMLADGTQARVRAELPETEAEILSIVRKVIDYCQKEGQLDNTRMTLKDLSIIADSFVQTLKNTYHPRIRYPEITPPAASVSPPTLPRQVPDPDTAIPEPTSIPVTTSISAKEDQTS